MNLPRELELIKAGDSFKLKQKVPAQFLSLTSSVLKISEGNAINKSKLPLAQALVSFDVREDTRAFTVVLSNSRKETLTITVTEDQLVIDRNKSGSIDFSANFASKPQVMPLKEPIRNVQMIIDQSSIEVMVNGGTQWMSCQLFPQQAYDILRLRSTTGKGFANLEIRSVKGIWSK